MTAGPKITIDYWRPYTDEDTGRTGRCSASEMEATECQVYLRRYSSEFRFEREPGEPWPYEYQKLMTLLQQAFDQGRAHQKSVIAGALKEAIGL